MKIRVHNQHAALRIFAGLLFVFMMANAIVANASPPDGAPASDDWKDYAAQGLPSGAGTYPDPYLITSPAELAYLAQQVNAGATTLKIGNKEITNFTAGFPNICFRLSDDIDLSAHYWIPIGKAMYSFRGFFEGNGHTVSGLKIKIDATETVSVGLFGLTAGSIQNLGVKLAKEGIVVSSTGSVYAGGIAGYLSTSSNIIANIQNCYVEAEKDGAVKITKGASVYAGGIAGCARSDSNKKYVAILHCYTTVNVEATGNVEDIYAGGIAGIFTGGTLSYSYATGNIKATGAVGGICGNAGNNTEILNCLALNKEISANRSCNRILGIYYAISDVKFSDNYAKPDMKVNGKTVNDSKNYDGASTWLDKLENDLTAAGSEWRMWDWTNPGALPQLKTTNRTAFSAQTTRPISDYLTLSPWSANAAEMIMNAGGGNGSYGSPILIQNAAELAYFAKQVNAEEALSVGSTTIANTDGFKDKYFALSADIDLSGHDWTPIGIDANGGKNFRGHFDGKGHVVKGLKVKITKATGDVYAGLFGWLLDGTVQNLGVSLADEGIEAYSTADNVYVYAGGIAGYMSTSENKNAIRNCYVEAENTGAVKITGAGANSYAYAGGIAGRINSNNSVYNENISLTHCYTTVNVEATAGGGSNSYAGGIIGILSIGTISYTFATGKIEAKGGGTKYAGGICGKTHATLTNCLALNEEVIAEGDYCGRITGDTGDYAALSSNYANPAMTIDGQPVANNATGKNGTSTCLNLFKDDLTKEPATDNGWNSGNWTWNQTNPNSTVLPTLTVVTTNADGQETGTYPPWQSNPAQTPVDAANYLSNQPQLHIKQPAEGGTLAVTATDTDGNTQETTLDDGAFVRPGTTLKLSATTGDNYKFVTFRTGNTEAGLADFGKNEIVMPATALWVSAGFQPSTSPEDPDQPVEPDPVYYTVTLPAVKGAVTDPGPGDHEVKEGDTFSFFLTLDTDYSQSKPVVTTDSDEPLTPRTSDGAYEVKNVHSDIAIRIEGIEPNDPVANEAIVSGTRVWCAGGSLHIRTDAPQAVSIYTFAGSLRRAFRSDGGEQKVELAPGSYIVVVGESSFKVIL